MSSKTQRRTAFAVAQAALAAVWATSLPAQEEYIDPAACSACHAEIATSFSRTGMGRSVAPVDSAANRARWNVDQPIYHERSRRSYQPLVRNGAYFLRRFQLNDHAERVNKVERQAHWIIGSGSHAQTFLHRDGSGDWKELPLSWYAADGGYWAMSPGYDQPHHAGFRRKIDSQCVFCHAAYPGGHEPGRLRPIDCQRCHGPGGDHIEAMRSSRAAAATDNRIVNPARLPPDRALEVCLQCHLQPTSRPLPFAIRRFDREPFSFRPGAPLGDYAVYFDHPEHAAQHEKFEVNGAGYRFLLSACFRSAGAERLNCVTCHDPHGEADRNDFRERVRESCRGCHAAELEPRSHGGDCLRCHMPRRRTEDAVHVAMTDHKIPRQPPANPEAPIDELAAAEASRYQGPVELFYPPELEAADRELYLAAAQVKDGTNAAAGTARLAQLLTAREEAPAEAFFLLGEGLRRTGDCSGAIAAYRAARDRGDGSPETVQFLGECLLRLGEAAAAQEALDAGFADHPRDAGLLMTRAVAAGQASDLAESIALLERAVAADSDLTLAWVNLGASLEAAGRLEEAERAYRQAVIVQPDHPHARTHLGNLLLRTGRARQAQEEFEEAVAVDARFAPAHLQLGLLAAAAGDVERARKALTAAARWGSPEIRQAALDEAAALAGKR